jgi:hypothetical protein
LAYVKVLPKATEKHNQAAEEAMEKWEVQGRDVRNQFAMRAYEKKAGMKFEGGG